MYVHVLGGSNVWVILWGKTLFQVQLYYISLFEKSHLQEATGTIHIPNTQFHWYLIFEELFHLNDRITHTLKKILKS